MISIEWWLKTQSIINQLHSIGLHWGYTSSFYLYFYWLTVKTVSTALQNSSFFIYFFSISTSFFSPIFSDRSRKMNATYYYPLFLQILELIMFTHFFASITQLGYEPIWVKFSESVFLSSEWYSLEL